MCSYSIVGNKIFCFFKKWVFAFLDEGTFQGEKSSSPKFWGEWHLKEEGVTDLEFFGWGLLAKLKGVRSIFQSGADTLDDTM